MQVQAINSPQQNNIGFKEAIPVFAKVYFDSSKIDAVTSEKLNKTLMLKTVHYLNNSISREGKPKVGRIIDSFRRFYKSWVSDFNGKISAYTCVDGKYENGEQKTTYYLLSGNILDYINGLRNKCKEATYKADGFDTAELRISKDNYYHDGKSKVVDTFKRYRPNGKDPHALVVYYEPIRRKNGKIYDYMLKNAEFIPVKDPENPSILLKKTR